MYMSEADIGYLPQSLLHFIQRSTTGSIMEPVIDLSSLACQADGFAYVHPA